MQDKRWIMVLSVILCFFSLCAFCRARTDITVHASLSNGCYLSAPYDVGAGDPFQWSVFLTNSAAIPVRLDVAARTDAIKLSGELLSRMSYVVTTNFLAPGETKRLTFSLEKGWSPSENFMCYVTMEAAILNRTTDEFSVNWHSAGTLVLPRPFAQPEQAP